MRGSAQSPGLTVAASGTRGSVARSASIAERGFAAVAQTPVVAEGAREEQGHGVLAVAVEPVGGVDARGLEAREPVGGERGGLGAADRDERVRVLGGLAELGEDRVGFGGAAAGEAAAEAVGEAEPDLAVGGPELGVVPFGEGRLDRQGGLVFAWAPAE
jgi:hypothetical protein